MRKKLLLSLLAAVCCMGMWAQTGPADNELWYTSTDGNPVAFNFSSIGTPVTNEKPDGKDYFVATFASDVTSLTHGTYDAENGNYPTLKTITVPACLKTLGRNVFWLLSNFESITFPEDSELESIGIDCFSESGLKSISIPKGVTTISETAFCCTYNMESNIVIPAGVKTLGFRTFYACMAPSITFAPGSQIETIDEQAFIGINVESFTIPASVKTIGEGAFYDAYIGTLIFEGTPETIAEDAFEEIGYGYNYEDPNFGPVYSMYSLLLWGEEKTAEELTDAEIEQIIEAAKADGWIYWPYDEFWDSPACFAKYGELPTLVLPTGWTGDEYVDEEESWYGGCFTLADKAQEVTEVGWTSMYLDYNYTLPFGAVAFYASKAEGNTITLQPIQGVIPANTGAIIKAPKESTLCITKTTETPTTTITDNLFRGVTEDTPNPGDVYVLSPETTESNPVFQNYTGAKLGANKAYILKSDLGANASNTLRFVIGGKATGIEAVSADDTITTATYNMAGQRVSDDYRGLVIKNGRKVMIR